MSEADHLSDIYGFTRCDVCDSIEDSLYCPYGCGIHGICRELWSDLEEDKKREIINKYKKPSVKKAITKKPRVSNKNRLRDDTLNRRKATSKTLIVRQLTNRQLMQIVFMALNNNDVNIKYKEKALGIINENKQLMTRHDRIIFEALVRGATNLHQYIRQLGF